MSRISERQTRILAVAPSTRGFGFAVAEGPADLVDWGVKGTRREKNAQCLTKVTALLEHYQPAILVLEDGTDRHCRRHPRIRKLLTDLRTLAATRQIRTRRFSRSNLRQVFQANGARTKHEIARAIAIHFPELEPRLPPRRRPWMSEDYRMSMFDAVALACAWFHFQAKRLRRSDNGD